MSALALAMALTLALAGAPVRAAPVLHLEPGAQVLAGDPVHLRVSGLAPGTEVTLSAERWWAGLSVPARGPRLMRAEAVFIADAQGQLDLRTAPAVRGSYLGVDPRGLFWSMQPVPGVDRAAVGSVDETRLRWRVQADTEQAEATLRLLPALPQVREQPVPELPGALFASLPGAQRRPAVILLGGSEGGSLITQGAAALASHGLAVLALPVYSPPGRDGAREIPALPADWAELPVELLDRARDWLTTRPEVDARRIALHGTSMGAVLALLGAVHRPWVSAVVASVPSDVVWEGWGPNTPPGQRSTFSVDGRALPFVPLLGYDDEVGRAARGEAVHIRRPHERSRAAQPEQAARARIPVERIRVPVLLIGGYDDQMWPSGSMAQHMAERRIEAGLPTEALLFPDAGHLLYDTGHEPTTGYNAGLRKTGGTPQANARAQAEAWPRTLGFLRRVLGAVD